MSRSRSPSSLVAWLVLSLAAPSALRGQAIQPDACTARLRPLSLVNETPLQQPFVGLGVAGPCPASRPAVELRLGIANQYVDLRDGARSAFLDAETYRVEVAAALPLGAGREVRLELPLRARGGGFLDSAIERWHSLLGLPQDTRRLHPRNRSLLDIADLGAAPERTLLHAVGTDAGLGDVTVRLLQRIGRPSSRWAAALRGSLELPTGSSKELLGSGAVDAALGLAIAARVAGPFWAHADLEAAVLGHSPIGGSGLSQSGTLSRALLAIEWKAGAGTGLLAQLESESAPLSTGLSDLDRRSLLITWGVQRSLSSRLEAELAMGDDLRVHTAPDFTIQTALRWTAP